MKRLLYFFIFISFSKVHADEFDPYVMASTSNVPEAMVESVNVITGDLSFAYDGITVNGAEPISIQNFYLSRLFSSENRGWFPLINHTLAIYHPRLSVFLVPERSGAFLRYLGSREGNFVADPSCFQSGFSHVSPFHPKNNQLFLDKKHDCVTVFRADGSRGVYKSMSEEETEDVGVFKNIPKIDVLYHLQEEILPNGNRIQYSWHKGCLEKITTTNPAGTIYYAWVKFHYQWEEKKKKHRRHLKRIVVETSDGRLLFLNHRKVGRAKYDNYFAILGDVESPEAPDESFEYDHIDNSKKGPIFPILNKRIRPDGRVQEITYCKENHIYRVNHLKAPLGDDETLYDAYRFSYHGNEKGYTDVKDAEDNLTRYYFDDLRLTKIERYQGSDGLLNVEQFTWGKGKESSLLLCRTFLDGNGLPFFSKRYFYDDKGNVLKEVLYGNLSGESKPLEIVEGFPVENGVENYVIKRSYDHRNLLIKEENQDGLVIIYEYHPIHRILQKKFICEKNNIKIRHFYEYLDKNLLHREIMDDGSTWDVDDYTGVTERHITIIHPKKGSPYNGMPETIEEKAFDITTKSEKLLKKTVNVYGKGGKIIKQDAYDADDSYRYSIFFDYDEKGNLIKQSNPIGQEAKFLYDANGNQTNIQDFGGQRKIRKCYDFSNRLIQESEIGEDGNFRLTFHKYDKKHNKIETIDPFDNSTYFSYNLFGEIAEATYPAVYDENEKVQVPVRKFEYDGINCKISETDPKGNRLEYQYNSYRSPIQIIYPDGSTETYTYYLNGKVKTHTDQLGVITKYAYDFLQREVKKEVYSVEGNLLKVEGKKYNSFHLLSEKDSAGFVTHYSYDFAGRKCKEKREGESQICIYDALGRLHKICECNDENTLVTAIERDILDRVIEERKEDHHGNVLSLIRFSYDNSGNLYSKTQFIGQEKSIEKYAYDSFNRIITFTNPLGYKTTYQYDEKFTNSIGQKILQKITKDPLHRCNIETFDALGRKIGLEKKNDGSQTIALEEMYYDLNGNLSRQISQIICPSRPIKKNYILWNYNSMNRLESLIEAAFSSDERKTNYDYTLRGELLQTIKPGGVVLSYGYDDLGRNISLTSSDGSVSYQYSYDDLDQLIRSEDFVQNQNFERILDHRGRVLQEIFPGKWSFKSAYDLAGRKTNFEISDQGSIQYQYDPLHIRKIIRKDANGFTLYAHHFEQYDLSGHLLKEGNNFYDVQYSYDLLGRKISHKSPFLKAQIHQFDPVGNLISQSLQGQKFFYQYDDLDQVIHEKGLFEHSYVFDSHNSRLQKDSEAIDVNLLHQDTSHYVYDNRGNPILKHTSTGDIEFRYDALDRLIQVVLPDSRTIEYAYDSQHRRLSKIVYSDGQQFNYFYLYDGQNEIGCANGKVIEEFRALGDTKFAEIGSAVGIEINGDIYFPLHDLCGNVASLISLSKRKPIENYFYGAFGEELALDDNNDSKDRALNPWRFSSKRSEETGLVFFGRRYYDPEQGHWLTPDPKGFTDTLNLYAFVTNNPLIHFDLYGLKSLTIAEREKNLVFDLDYEKKKGFEKPRNFDLQSFVRYKLKKEDGIGFGFTHGINTSWERCLNLSKYFSEICDGYNFEVTYMPTGGKWKDIQRCKDNLNLVITGGVKETSEKLMNFFNKYPNGSWLEICPSGGAGILHNALLTIEEKFRFQVSAIAIAPSVFLERGLCKNPLNLVSEGHDFVPSLHKRCGKMGNVEKNSNVIYLEKHPDANYWDHDADSPTYRLEIEKYFINFLKESHQKSNE